MAIWSPSRYMMPAFKRACFKIPGEDRKPIFKALGRAILAQAENEYADLYVFTRDGTNTSEVIYFVTRADREGYVLVDDLSDIEASPKYGELLPAGLRKACTLCDSINEEILSDKALCASIYFDNEDDWERHPEKDYLKSLGWTWWDFVKNYFKAFYDVVYRHIFLHPNAYNND